MNHNKKKSNLKEAAAPISASAFKSIPLELQNLSLDMKVDSYIMRYEKDSMPTQATYAVPGTDSGINFEFKKTFLALLEAEEDPFAAGAGDMPVDMGADPAAAAPAGDAAPPASPSLDIPNPRFNVGNFAQSIARLLLNYENLLDPRTTILNRVQVYIEKNYDAGVAKEVMQILESEFRLVPKDTSSQGETFPNPLAAGSMGDSSGG